MKKNIEKMRMWQPKLKKDKKDVDYATSMEIHDIKKKS